MVRGISSKFQYFTITLILNQCCKTAEMYENIDIIMLRHNNGTNGHGVHSI